ncbi:hypothetical protein ACS0TY_017834 [Phlomoides rotata]
MCDCGQLMPSSLRQDFFSSNCINAALICPKLLWDYFYMRILNSVYVSPRVFEGYCQHLEKEMLCNDIIERLPAATISVDEKY